MSLDKQGEADRLWEHYMGKYQNPNPIARYLTDNFFSSLSLLINKLPTSASILEIGCGPGESTRRILKMLNGQYFEASEFEQLLVDKHLENDFPIRIQQESVYELQRNDGSFDCVLLLEVLEHLDDYEKALKEIFRVSRDTVIVSVPNEPLWSTMNFLRGKYWRDFGNTPGHVNNWSTRSFKQLVAKYGDIVCVRRPLPWTMIQVKVRATRG